MSAAKGGNESTLARDAERRISRSADFSVGDRMRELHLTIVQ
jgi:hypothetical protein